MPRGWKNARQALRDMRQSDKKKVEYRDKKERKGNGVRECIMTYTVVLQ